MSRLLKEKFASFVSGSFPWTAADTNGCAFDSTVTYNGHRTLRYDPGVAGRANFLTYTLQGGFLRLWSRVVYRVGMTMYEDGEPTTFLRGLPLGINVDSTNGTTARVGLYQSTRELIEYLPGVWTFQSYQPFSQLNDQNSRTGFWNGDVDDPLALADWRNTDWHTWDTLVEQYNGGKRIRIRGWRDGIPVIDQIYTPAPEEDVGYWKTWTLWLDPALYVAKNKIWIGEISVWDAERDPDPFELTLLWGDGLSDTGWDVKPKYEQAWNNQLYWDGAGVNGAYCSYGQYGHKYGFFSKDIPVQRSLGIHLHHRPYTLPAAEKVMFLGWGQAAGPTTTFNSNTKEGRLLIKPDRHLVLESPPGVEVATSPDPLDALSVNFLPSDFKHLYVDIGIGPNGWLRVVYKGEDWWLAENVPTAAAAYVGCVEVGQWDDPGPSGTYGYDVCNLLISTGVEWRMVELPWHPPNWDHGFSDMGMRTCVVPGYGPSEFQGLIYNDHDRAAGWMDLYLGQGYEPDEDAGMVWSNPDSTPSMASFEVEIPELPDTGCGGLLAAVIPLINCRRSATVKDYGRYYGPLNPVSIDAGSDFQPDGDPFGDIGITVRPQEGTATYGKSKENVVRYSFSPSEPTQYAGDYFGFYAFEPAYWSVNPATEDSWDAAKLPWIGVQGLMSYLWITMFGAYLALVRPSNKGPTLPDTLANYYPKKNLDWRAASITRDTQIVKTLDWRQIYHAWVMKNLEWTPFPEDITGRVAPYCPDGPTLYPIRDDFKLGRINTRLWSPYENGDSRLDTGDGYIVLTTRNSFSRVGSEMGLYANNGRDFTGTWAQFEILAGPDVDSGGYAIVGLSPLEVRLGNAKLEVFDNNTSVANVPQSVGSLVRFRHDVGVNTLYIERSGDGGETWYQVWSSVGYNMYSLFPIIALYNLGNNVTPGYASARFGKFLTGPVGYL